MLQYLLSRTRPDAYLAATLDSHGASPFILATGRAFLVFGGYIGGDTVVTVTQLEDLAAEGKLRFVLDNGNLAGKPAIANLHDSYTKSGGLGAQPPRKKPPWRLRDGTNETTIQTLPWRLEGCHTDAGAFSLQACQIGLSPNLLLYAVAFTPDSQRLMVTSGSVLWIDPPALLVSRLTGPVLLVVVGALVLALGRLLILGMLATRPSPA